MTRTQDPSGGADKYQVPALERGLRLLQEFGRGSHQLSAPELVRRLNLPRATVFRMLSTLESMDFLERIDGGSEYRLGMAVMRLDWGCLQSQEDDGGPDGSHDRRYGFQTLNRGISR
ncbi:hypothetical protein GCM10027082_43380 [Comamonas humi]